MSGVPSATRHPARSSGSFSINCSGKLDKMNLSLVCTLLLSFLPFLAALYSAKSQVVQVGANDFDKEVLKFPGVVIVEFYAPWCGHCKSLAPEYEKAAKLLHGVVKVVAVDATAHESLAQKYQIQGFPTLKVFGADKKSPVDYQGQRTSDGIVTECMKAANNLVKDRKAGKTKKSEKSGGGEKAEKKSKKGSKSAVIELTDANFDALVLESNDHWLVEFYAPWCGHCKKLAPEWEQAAGRLAPQGVKLGAVDATVHTDLAQKYGIKGFPTIKLFGAGSKSGMPQDYQGAREADAIVDFATTTLEQADVPISINQLTSKDVFAQACADKHVKVCAILFVPHILDTGAKGRNDYLAVYQDLAKSFRKMPFAFLWSEAGAQEQLENTIELNGNVPTIAVLSLEKNVFAVPKASWSKKNMQSFLSGVLSGTEKTFALPKVPSVVSVDGWDGKDGQIVEEAPLDDLYNDL
ncbi:hypothetical protein EON65_15510 [archaeon]|nr:MAG: hypothetical protein EON65_15510 [archaeon]